MRSKKEKFNAKIPGPDQTRYLQFQTQQSYAKRKKEKATPHQNTSLRNLMYQQIRDKNLTSRKGSMNYQRSTGLSAAYKSQSVGRECFNHLTLDKVKTHENVWT